MHRDFLLDFRALLYATCESKNPGGGGGGGESGGKKLGNGTASFDCREVMVNVLPLTGSATS
jgi:hypothetical protein